MKLDRMTNEELLALDAQLCADPANLNPVAGSIFRYTPATHRKLDAIAKQIAHNIRQKRVAAGIPINDEGYSGRQTNKRR